MLSLCFQGAYAEAHDFRRHIDCFKDLKGKLWYNSDRYVSGYVKKLDVVALPDPSDSNTWLIVTENSVYSHRFEESVKDSRMFYKINSFDLMETYGTHFELPLPSGPTI